MIENEIYIRLGFFFGMFAVMAFFELVAPRRRLETSKGMRWFSNISITFINSALVRLAFPVLAVGVAFFGLEQGWGILNNIEVPELLAGIIAIIVLDLTIYVQHVVFHLIPPCWKLHMMHHADIDIDVTTGARFHPVEIMLSMCIKISVVAALGAPPWSVVVFEVLLNATAMFNHSNINIPVNIDRVLRLFVVTPDMHRVHHSVIIRETNSNYGFNFPWWDRFFKTYNAQPVKGHTGMKIGLANFRDPGKLTLAHILAIPFQKKER